MVVIRLKARLSLRTQILQSYPRGERILRSFLFGCIDVVKVKVVGLS